LNYWTTDNGNILKVSIYTNGVKEGEASFHLYCNKFSKQRTLMEQLFITQKMTVSKIVNMCYKEEKKGLMQDGNNAASKLYGLVRALISGIRTKFNKCGINNEILTPLGQNVDAKSTVTLRVKCINSLDQKHFESKDKASSKPPDELPSKDKPIDDYGNDAHENGNDNDVDYDPDKHIDGFEDDPDE